jgi:hypothetical protein
MRLELAFDDTVQGGCHPDEASANAVSIGKSRFKLQP